MGFQFGLLKVMEKLPGKFGFPKWGRKETEPGLGCCRLFASFRVFVIYFIFATLGGIFGSLGMSAEVSAGLMVRLIRKRGTSWQEVLP